VEDIKEATLLEALKSRSTEIEEAILARVYAVDDPTTARDSEYLTGLKGAVSAAVGFGISALERGERTTAPIPEILLLQARRAARAGVSLDTVLRRYVAGHTLLGEFVMQEGADKGATGGELSYFSRVQAAVVNHLLTAVTKEYVREAEGRSHALDHVYVERIRRLLAGELIEVAELGYELRAYWHIGVIATGAGSLQAVRGLALALDCRLLLARPDEGRVWAWFGSSRRLEVEELLEAVAGDWPEEVMMTIGEPGRGIAGWRLSHRQAHAALPVALRSSTPVVRYSAIALVAAVLRDDLLPGILEDSYLAPLAQGRDEGRTLRLTLREYFRVGRQASAAASALEVSRQTVNNRLRAIEERIGRPLVDCLVELEAALRLAELSERKPV
jgi:hypothetical protein